MPRMTSFSQTRRSSAKRESEGPTVQPTSRPFARPSFFNQRPHNARTLRYNLGDHRGAHLLGRMLVPRRRLRLGRALRDAFWRRRKCRREGPESLRRRLRIHADELEVRLRCRWRPRRRRIRPRRGRCVPTARAGTPSRWRSRCSTARRPNSAQVLDKYRCFARRHSRQRVRSSGRRRARQGAPPPSSHRGGQRCGASSSSPRPTAASAAADVRRAIGAHGLRRRGPRNLARPPHKGCGRLVHAPPR